MAAVNPKLETLMRVIEDNQDKMTEGEYLEAMNALAALYREIPPPYAAAGAGGAVVDGPPPSYSESVHLFDTSGIEQRVDRAAWYRVSSEHPEHAGITFMIWSELSQEERDIILYEATECVITRLERECRNPEPEMCPFIARHAVSGWRLGDGEYKYWECVCGYRGKTKLWQKHEQGERHQNWAKHRTVSRRKIESMKKAIQKDEAGTLCRYKPQSAAELGGIRYFTVTQERNEWTHPEMYDDPIHRTPILNADGVMTWFVHPRAPCNSREYL